MGGRILFISGWGFRKEVAHRFFSEATALTFLESIHEPPSGAWDVVVGWSAGAMRAIELISAGRITARAIVLLAPTLRFAGEGRGRVSLQSLHNLMDLVEKNKAAAIRRFTQLCGDIICREFMEEGEVTVEGLRYLERTDLRNTSLSLPTLVLHGEKDDVIPCEAGQETALHLSGTYCEIKDGSHLLPFLPKVSESVRSYCQQYVDPVS